MKIDRLMGITIYLLNHGKTSAQTLFGYVYHESAIGKFTGL